MILKMLHIAWSVVSSSSNLPLPTPGPSIAWIAAYLAAFCAVAEGHA